MIPGITKLLASTEFNISLSNETTEGTALSDELCLLRLELLASRLELMTLGLIEGAEELEGSLGRTGGITVGVVVTVGVLLVLLLCAIDESVTGFFEDDDSVVEEEGGLRGGLGLLGFEACPAIAVLWAVFGLGVSKISLHPKKYMSSLDSSMGSRLAKI